MTVLVIVAHSDDQVLGPGGTIAKYASEGEKVYTFIASFGESSHPHFKKEIISKIRVDEAKKADKLLGGSGVFFIGARDGKLKEDRDIIKKEVRRAILKYKPKKIITHAEDDALPDHVLVNKVILEVYDELKNKKLLSSNIGIYSFGVWRFFKLTNRLSPKLFVDISDFFQKKLEVLEVFKSQKSSMILLKWSVYLKAIIAGLKHKSQFAEEFHKLR